ncbi:MAG: spore coat protein [Clostridia bacterium]|nr:spore coat protein [Clostridia bacterium]
MTNQTTMTQQELLTDILNQERTLIKEYASNITESSCTNLRQLLLNNMTEVAADQYTVFEQMKNRQMYETKKAQQNEVQSTRQKVQQLKQETGF